MLQMLSILPSQPALGARPRRCTRALPTAWPYPSLTLTRCPLSPLRLSQTKSQSDHGQRDAQRPTERRGMQCGGAFLMLGLGRLLKASVQILLECFVLERGLIRSATEQRAPTL